MNPRAAASFADLLADIDSDEWQDVSDDELIEICMDDLAVMDLEEAFK